MTSIVPLDSNSSAWGCTGVDSELHQHPWTRILLPKRSQIDSHLVSPFGLNYPATSINQITLKLSGEQDGYDSPIPHLALTGTL